MELTVKDVLKMENIMNKVKGCCVKFSNDHRS